MNKPEAKERLAKVHASLRGLRIDLSPKLNQEQDTILFDAIMQLGATELIARSLYGIDDETMRGLKLAKRLLEYGVLAPGEDVKALKALERLLGEGE